MSIVLVGGGTGGGLCAGSIRAGVGVGSGSGSICTGAGGGGTCGGSVGIGIGSVSVSVVLVGGGTGGGLCAGSIRIGAGDVGIGPFVPVGIGRCWLSVVALVVTFVPVHAGVDIARLVHIRAGKAVCG